MRFVKVFGLLVAALLATLAVERQFRVTLPRPTGSFAVGRAVYDWGDSTTRELLVWIWYPAAASTAEPDDYVPAAVRSRRPGPLLFRLLTRDPSKVHGHSLRQPGLSPQQSSYPVVIMRAGASAPVVNYSTLAEDLASHGYVVVGFDAPYRTIEVDFPDGRVFTRTDENNPELVSGPELASRATKLLAAWTADTQFVLGRLQEWNAGRLDLAHVGIFGHSFGGATAAQFCSMDSRCKAGIDIDGALFGSVLQTGINQPFLFLLSSQGDFSSDAEVRQIMADIQSVYDRLPPDSRFRLSIRGANHFTFSDDGAILKSGIARGLLRLFGRLSIDGRRQLVVTAHVVHSFFDAYLRKESAGRPGFSSRRYPEIQRLP